MVHRDVDKLMRNPHFISVRSSDDGLAWVVTMNSMRAGNKWVNIHGEYVPDDLYDIYVYKGSMAAPVITDPRIKTLKGYNPGDVTDSCYIVDIDGTIALINNRSPYDGSKAHTDVVNTPVTDLLHLFMDASTAHKMVYSTGRSEKYREVTEQWLKANGLWFEGRTLLYMRPEGEKKPDAEVKYDNYMEHIDGKFNVKLVLEDRGRVVRMYRDDLGLPTLVPWYDNF